MYQALANPNLYHCGYKWVVVDEKYNHFGKFTNRADAEREAQRLNDLEKESGVQSSSNASRGEI